MSSDFWAAPPGRWLASLLLPHPVLTSQLTGFIVIMEFVLPFLLLTPVVRLQALSLLGFCAMQIGFAACLHIEAFTFLAISCLSGFFPASFWKWMPGLERSLDKIFGGRAEGVGGSPEAEARFQPLGPLASALVSWAVIGVIWSCASSVNLAPAAMESLMSQPWRAFGLAETWGMFNPPPYQGGWYVFRGLTQRGDWVNLAMEGTAESLAAPRETDLAIPTSRHYLLYNATFHESPGLKEIQAIMINNFRTRWEATHPEWLDHLLKVEVYRFYREFDSETGKFTRPKKHFVMFWPPSAEQVRVQSVKE